MANIKIYIYAVVGIAIGLVILLAPEHYRQEGRLEEQAKSKLASDGAVLKREFEFLDVKRQLETERKERQNEKIKHEEKFNKYVSDVRAGRIAGLRVTRADLCTANTEEATSTIGTIEDKTVRLPREVEEGLFRFAHDRDQIILDFEAFKQEVRIAKCFAD